MVVVIDNYDSFTWNLVQYLGELGAVVQVFRNDQVTPAELVHLKPEGLLLSPGPGKPDDAGITLDCIERFAHEVPILGVCLGHQALAQAFGSRIVRASRLMHGRTSSVHHDGRGVFEQLPSPFTATRYHSLIADRKSMSEELEVSAWTEEGEVMGLRHRQLPIEGVQFHPESFLTEHGHSLLQRFLDRLPSGGGAPSEQAA